MKQLNIIQNDRVVNVKNNFLELEKGFKELKDKELRDTEIKKQK